MRFDANGLEILDREECLTLMASVPVGRIVFTDRALPAIQPVNFVLQGEDVIIATASGSKLAAATSGAIVAFEVDAFDAGDEAGWSVTVLGQARAVYDSGELSGLSRLPLNPWIPGRRDHFIRIRSDVVSGRRIHPTMVEARP
ncbi:pyridoxamine 5'-phosphate oxidase family protein [Actinoallomurus soli]|uniref:pyridoxamine 5'-phosphate oxidase family protein n=1 Tax=Actinoallomurus soli TaxID=2952535 RepID=UPI002091F58E|nr:pyridoxamine 5'-phosphate oxidase family protein [Actinoallomurus soli]MCO5973477.1 pyridoxamine 5'-phosphate oxidase family protein [Actinoallomurus soli]